MEFNLYGAEMKPTTNKKYRSFVLLEVADTDLAPKKRSLKISRQKLISLINSGRKRVSILTPRFLGIKKLLSTVKNMISGNDCLSKAKAKLKGNFKNDPGRRQKYANALQKKGYFKEALAEYLWCLDIGMKVSRGYTGVRTSYLLGDLVKLGKKYPKATSALKERRDSAQLSINTGSLDFDVIHDFIAYNRELKQRRLTLKLFDELRGESPELAVEMVDSVSDFLLKAKRYDNFLKYAKDFKEEISRKIRNHNRLMEDEYDKKFKALMKKCDVEEMSKYFEAYSGVNQDKKAREVLVLILDFDKGLKTFKTLMKSATNARNSRMLEAILENAKTALAPEKYDKIERISVGM